MPDNNELLEWNEENFARILETLFRETESDDALRQRLLTEPFEVLSTRIAIPDEYRGGIFAREKGQKALMVYVPAREGGVSARALPEGTTNAEEKPDYEVLCTIVPLW